MRSVVSSIRTYAKHTMSLQYLPKFLSVWQICTCIITYITAVSNKHVYFMFPYISDTGAMPPESCIMAQGFNIGAAIMAIGLYIRYRQIDNDIKTKNIKLAPMWNNVGMVFGCLGSLGVSLVGNFQETSYLPMHLLGALLALGVGSLYISVQTWISFIYINARDRKITRLMFYVRLAFNVVMFPLVVSVAVFALLSVKHYKGNSYLWWTETDGGYEYRLISVFSEWLLYIIFFVYISTFAEEFKQIDLNEITFKFQQHAKN